MKPFVEITESVGGEKWVTLSLVRPLLYKLIEKHLPEDSSDSRLIKKKNLKKVILRDLKTQYQNSQVLNKACFFRDLSLCHFSQKETDSRIYTEALEEMASGLNRN